MARILIVDDAEQNLLLYQLYLKGDEFEVATARGGKEALEAVARAEFDLILLDVVMPDMDGIEVCRRLKATPRTASIPVIFFTGRLRDEADRQSAYEVGAVDYLTKPVEKQELVARIRVMLRFRQERASLERKNADLADAVRKSTALISAVAEQLEDYRGLLEARSEEGHGVVVIDSQTRVLGMSSVARELFPDLEVGTVTREVDRGPLGVLAEFFDAGLTEGNRDVEVQAGGGAVLRIGIAQVPDMDAGVLRVSDVSRENHIKRRLTDRMPEDLLAKIEQIATEGRGSYQISKFVGQSPVLRELTEQVDKLRQSRCTALIQGETGSGKELVASALHYDGPYGSRPFIPIHCGAISKELIESELFGYEKGAFTGATTRKDGLFAACDGGTIFLDEIAETSLDLQVKLLRVLQQGEVRPVGATSPRHVDVRIIAATNKNLKQMVREGRFREDLYYRLDVVTLHLPPLRRRKEDIPLLVFHFLKKLNAVYNREEPVADTTRGAMRAMQAYDWPGNVRELENVIDRAFALGVGNMLTIRDLPARIRDGGEAAGSDNERPAERPVSLDTLPAGQSFDKQGYERQAMVATLTRCDGNKIEAARRLRMSRSTFYRKYKEYRITGDEHAELTE